LQPGDRLLLIAPQEAQDELQKHLARASAAIPQTTAATAP
jgi:hypothetical protein